MIGSMRYDDAKAHVVIYIINIRTGPLRITMPIVVREANHASLLGLTDSHGHAILCSFVIRLDHLRSIHGIISLLSRSPIALT